MEHSFNIEAAQKYGINAAIVLRHLQYWIIKNKTHKKNYHDGRYWTYYSVSAFTKIFPYLSRKQVRKALQILIDEKVILKGDYNKFKNTKTCWYAFVEESLFAPEGKPEKSSSAPEGKPEKSSSAPEGKPIALEGRPFALGGEPFAPEGKHLSDNKTDKYTNKKPDNSETSQKTNLSSNAPDDQHLGFSLLVCRGVNEKTARRIVYAQHTPLTCIDEVVKNGLAKEAHARETGGNFRLKPGYILKALKQARSEGKLISPTKLSKKMSAKIAASKAGFTPLSEQEFQKRKSRQVAALTNQSSI